MLNSSLYQPKDPQDAVRCSLKVQAGLRILIELLREDHENSVVVGAQSPCIDDSASAEVAS